MALHAGTSEDHICWQSWAANLIRQNALSCTFPTLWSQTPPETELLISHDISEECALANKVKHQDPILVILGNPPYSGARENSNAWTESLLKTDLNGATSYYKVDCNSLNERNSKALQDDYVKFIRFAQWKIHKAGRGIVGMITNHGYLDNPTFRGMRQNRCIRLTNLCSIYTAIPRRKRAVGWRQR